MTSENAGGNLPTMSICEGLGMMIRRGGLIHGPHTVDACGRLMFFMSLWKRTKCNRLSIVEGNLLIRVQHELPPLYYHYYKLPAMVQIKVDLDKKCYHVVVVGYTRGGLAIETYYSGTREWTRTAPPCGFIFGPVHDWIGVGRWCRSVSRRTPGAYDFAEGKLELYSNDNLCTGEFVIASVFEKDRMFVLEQTLMDTSHRGMLHQVFYITEYNFEDRRKDWVQGKSYECPAFQDLTTEKPVMRLYACDGFQTVVVYNGWTYQYYWLLSLSTSEWSRWTNILKPTEGLLWPGHVLCKAFWNVIP